MAQALFAAAIVAFGLAAWSANAHSWTGAGAFVIWGGFLSYVGWKFQRRAVLLDAVVRAREAKDEAEAERVLDHALSRTRGALERAALSFMQGSLAYYRAELVKADALLSEAMAIPLPRFERLAREAMPAQALAVRAMVRAARFGAAGASEDATAAIASRWATAQSVSRARLAQALVLFQRGDTAALGAHLASHGRTIRRCLPVRERTLVRALRVLSRMPPGPYRTPSQKDECARDRSEWLEAVLPGSTECIDSVATADLPEDPTKPAPDSNSDFRSRSARRGLRLSGSMLVAAILIPLLTWQVLSASTRRSVTPGSISLGAFFLVLTCVATVALVIAGTRSLRKDEALNAALRDLELDDREEVRMALEAITHRSSARAVRAIIALGRADEMRGDFERCIERTVRAKKLTGRPGLRNPDLRGSVLALRAIAFAGMGRERKALRELDELERTDPQAFARARRSVHLRLAALSGDMARTARIARCREHQSDASQAEEILGMLATLALGTQLSSRGREELGAEMQEVRGWLERVAPALLELGARALSTD